MGKIFSVMHIFESKFPNILFDIGRKLLPGWVGSKGPIGESDFSDVNRHSFRTNYTDEIMDELFRQDTNGSTDMLIPIIESYTDGAEEGDYELRLLRMYCQYAKAMMRKRPGSELWIYNFMSYVRHDDVYVFEDKGSYIIWQYSNGFFKPSHFTPKTILDGYNAVRELCMFDNIIFAVTNDIGDMLEKIGLYTEPELSIQMFFRDALVSKNIYTTSNIVIGDVLTKIRTENPSFDEILNGYGELTYDKLSKMGDKSPLNIEKEKIFKRRQDKVNEGRITRFEKPYRTFDSSECCRDRLYHTIFFKDAYTEGDVISTVKDILKNGLRTNDNGEAEGIWFSNGHLFYGANPHAMIVSIPNDAETAEAVGFNTYDFENRASILVAHKPIPSSLLTIEQMPICMWKDFYDRKKKAETIYEKNDKPMVKRTVILNETQLRRIVAGAVKRIVNEGLIDYAAYDDDKGDFDDAPDSYLGMECRDDNGKQELETDFYTFYDLLEEHGWVFFDYRDVRVGKGRTGVRYTLSPGSDENGVRATTWEQLKTDIEKAFGRKAIFPNATYRYAPGTKYQTVIILD